MDNLERIAAVVMKDTVQQCTQCTRGFLSTRECKLHEQQHFKPILIQNIFCTNEIENPLKSEYETAPHIKIEIEEYFENSNGQSEEWNESLSKYKYEDKTWLSKEKKRTSRSNTQRLKHNKKHNEKIRTTGKDVHLNKGPDGYECPHCPKKYTKHLKIVEHYKEHVIEMPYRCEVCSQSFLRKRDVTYHKTRMHSTVRKPKIFKCPHCAKVFKHKFNLQPHIYTHTGEKPHKCKECGRGFTQPCGLLVHMKAHRNLKEHECPICQKCFNNVSTLYVHKKIHENNREFKCSFCPKDFNDNSARRRHERIHTGNMMYSCELCEKKFTDFSGYRAHKLRHDKNNRKYECDLCPKAFYTKWDLIAHRKAVHETERPCRFCTEKFTTRKALTIHLVGVHGDVKFQCDICKFRTLSKNNILKHIQTHYTRGKDKSGKTKTMLKQVKYYY